MLRPLTPARHPDLIVSGADRDDALVWRRPHGPALVASVDVFTPIVDDARTWGSIAAANAASDIHAMGATPLFGLAIAAWPRETLSLELLSQVLAGGQDAAADDGWIVAGGHTIDGAEPLYGLAIVGEVADGDLCTNAGARPGDALVLTKPLGTGIITTAVKRHTADAVASGGMLDISYHAALRSMTRSNAAASRAARDHGVHAMTDVTGFGLLGHLAELCTASGVGAQLQAASVPRLPGIDTLIADGLIPGGTHRNLDDSAAVADLSRIDEDTRIVLADAQTSGGLLVALDDTVADALVATLRADGHDAARIGSVVPAPASGARIVVT